MNAPLLLRRVDIACGGTGGHLFPGLAVAHELAARGAEVTLLVSPKEVDQQALRSAGGRFRVATLPLVGFSGANFPAFITAFGRGYRVTRQMFSEVRPEAVLAMGGFTSAPPILAGRRLGLPTFLHESNTVPGRANRWLARWVTECFTGFAAAAPRLANRHVTVTGTPVRPEFHPRPAAEARTAFGLLPDHPVLLIMGGSQGAQGVNQLVTATVPQLARRYPTLQFIHLTGNSGQEAVHQAYAAAGVPAKIHPFSHRMELALAAATVAISRSGASSLAELAAVRVPAVLVPYPAATDDHQRHNAAAFVAAGAARWLEQTTAGPEDLLGLVGSLLDDEGARERMSTALASLDVPAAAARIAEGIWRRLGQPQARPDLPAMSSGSRSAPLQSAKPEVA